MKFIFDIKECRLVVKTTFFISAILLSQIILAQNNLVKNYSFEDYIVCPSANNQGTPPPWYSAGKVNKVGYVNACNPDPVFTVPTNSSGYQYAKTGSGYIGIYFINGLNQNNRNYVQAKLTDSLNKEYYYVEFYSNLGNTQKYACNNIGLLLTNNPIYVDTIAHPLGVLPANPQILNYGNPIITDTLNWVKVSGIYKAIGGEQFITIGNFKTDAQTSYKQVQPTGYNGAGYLIDDVSVIPLDSFCLKAAAGKDTAITLGDSVFIGSLTSGLDSLKWQIQNNSTTIDSARPGFWVHPLATTSYVLQQVVNGCFSADTVVVTVGTVPLTMMNYELRMMNDRQIENRWITANEVNVSHFNIQCSVNGKDFTTIGKVVANNQSYNEYLYTDDRLLLTVDGSLYYRIESIDKDGKKQYSDTRTLNLKPQTLNGVSIYPNPASDVITIGCKGAKELLIIDYLGRIVYKQILRQTQNDNSQSSIINVQEFAKGLYIVKAITNNNQTVYTKFIKQ